MERPTFSPFWHRVRTLKPRLRPHVQITRQHYRGRRWHVVHDPASNQFYRLSPVAHDFVCLLDGTREIEEAWKISLAKFGDASPTQNEIIELMGQLYNSNLIAIDTTPETEQLLQRGKDRTKKRIAQQAIGIMYFRLRLFNPDRLLTWVEPFLRPVLNRWGFMAWCAFVIYAFLSMLPQWNQLVRGFDQYVLQANPASYGWILAVFVALKLCHELGHGVICKRFGGQVPEFGVMLLVLIPSPFVDASSCWAFPNKWQRIAVGAGGMLFELFLASVAAFVWLNAPEGSLTRQLAYHAMLTASVATVLFNANPLMKFDGYYMLSDFLEAPNMMQRSQQMLTYLMQRYVYRVKNARCPSTLTGEKALLLTYGVLSMCYRVFLFFAITLFILGQMFALGLILAVWSTAVWFIMPVGKFAHWLATSPQLADKRARAVLTSLVLGVAIALLVGIVPMPDWRRASGVIESTRKTGIFFKTDGFVTAAFVKTGQRVREGDVLVTLESPEIVRAIAETEGELADARVALRMAQEKGEVGTADVAQRQIALLDRAKEELLVRQGALTVRATQDGVIVGGDPAALIGAYAQVGEPLCGIVDDLHLRIVATLPQGEGAWFNELSPDQFTIRFRTASQTQRVFSAINPRSPAAAQSEIPHPSLSFKGGGDLEPDPRDEHGRLARRPQFTVYVDPVASAGAADQTDVGKPGERVYLVFTLPSKPVLYQVVDRVHKAILGRVNL